MRKSGLGKMLASLLGACSVAFALLTPGVALAASKAVDRVAGASRYDTMQQLVMTAGTSDYALIATGSNFPDALSANGLAGALRCPIILTNGSQLSPQARAALTNAKVKEVIILGGEGVVSPAVETAIQQMGIESTRLDGSNRIETSLMAALSTVSLASTTPTSLILATGTSFADSLSIGPWSFVTASPLILVDNSGKLTDVSLEIIAQMPSINQIVIVGGTNAVSDQVKIQLGSKYNYVRLSGANRFETSRAIAEWETAQGLSWNRPYVTTGMNFPDALAAAPICGGSGDVLLLVNGPSGPSIEAVSAHSSKISSCLIIGGESAVDSDVAVELFNILNP